ncbi:MAG: hypothetical protein RBT65_18270 [Methanolobus sp.]|nr:hypothetical protein [Methanolobus sp.]
MNKRIFGLILAMMVVPITIAPVFAQQSPPINGSVPPNYTFPRVDNPAYQRKLNQVKPAQINAEPILKKTLYVGTNNQFKEPENWAYVNYCGPASTQVALRARITNIPSLDSIGQCEYIDPNWGVYMSNVTPCLNSYLNTSFYWTDYAPDSATLASRLKSDVDQGYAMLTGVYTSGMGGWSFGTYHIITLFGYDNTSSTNKKVDYVDTASSIAGYNGLYFNFVSLDNLWWNISQNNVQAW